MSQSAVNRETFRRKKRDTEERSWFHR